MMFKRFGSHLLNNSNGVERNISVTMIFQKNHFLIVIVRVCDLFHFCE